MKVNGWYALLPYPEEATSEHGVYAASVPHQSCTTHPEKISRGSSYIRRHSVHGEMNSEYRGENVDG